ncbi:hypothetical protein, partial [Agathobaculum sp.]|uniref:hypothetical protein n=1 Tax=Agathobaculum sp. TaxID=2048138 RepID=UPI003AB16CA4
VLYEKNKTKLAQTVRFFRHAHYFTVFHLNTPLRAQKNTSAASTEKNASKNTAFPQRNRKLPPSGSRTGAGICR